MPISAVAYVSELSALPSVDEAGQGQAGSKLRALVDDACRFNRGAGVTGVLLFDGTRFFQYLEGPEDGLRVAYGRVLDSRTHSELVVLQEGHLPSRQIPYWPMQMLDVDQSNIDALATADWTGFKRRGDHEALNATGMDVLLSVVNRHAEPAP